MTTSVVPPTLRRRGQAGPIGLGLAAAALNLAAAAAQETAPLQGLVADQETGQAVPSAKVSVVGSSLATQSGSDGIFEFSDVPLGKVFVRVQARGYPTVVEEVDLGHDVAVVFIPILLPSAAATLEELVVIGKRGGSLDKTAAKTAADLLALQIPGIGALTRLSDRRNNPVRIGLRGRGSINLGAEPVIVLDGVRMAGDAGYAMGMLRQIPATDVKSIRVLRGQADGFIYGSADGVIVIETHGH